MSVAESRFGRVGHNQRNLSNEVFNFQGNSPIESNRFQRIDAATAERERQHNERQKRLERDDFRRNWKSDIERSRWQKMATEYDTKQECLTAKQIKARIGKNSVSYNPITLEYHNNPGGEALAREDAKAMLRTSVRSLNLYLKNNSFDPMRCQDVPKDVSAVFGVTETKPKKVAESKSLTPPKYGRRSHQPARQDPDASTLAIPKTLLNYTNSNIELLKNRKDDSVAEILSFLRNDKERWARHY